MRCFEIDLNNILKIKLLGKEELIPPRYHCTRYAPEYILYAVFDGELYLEESGKEIKLSAGDIYLFKKGDYHKPLKSTFCKYYYVHFITDYFTEFEMTGEEYYDAVKEKRTGFLKCNKLNTDCYSFMKVLLRQEIKIENKGFFDYFISMLENNIITYGYQDIEKRMNISNAFSTLLLKLENAYIEQIEKDNISESPKVYHTVKNIVSYIESNYKTDIYSHDIEKKFYLNFDYANRIFKRIMGCSIMKYRNMLRINDAKASMLVSDKSLSEISDDVGFQDKCYFNRVFKKYEGITPGEYRKQMSKNILFDLKNEVK